ncbi:MAG: RagB/SusD family nutrient uptake outer membrane protein [Bacteroidota bacterium]
MKNINIIAALAILLFFASCESLDITPQENDVIQPDFENIEDLNKSLFGIYEGLTEEGAYTGFLVALGEWPADDLKIASENTGQGAIVHEWDYEQGDQDLEDCWEDVYNVIRRANFVILNAANFTGENAAEANQYRSEALVIRGLAHYELSKVFGERYNGGSGLTVPYITDPMDIFQEASRITYSEMYGNIKDDINAAIGGFSDDFNPNRASAALGYGVLARIALIEEDWSAAVANATNAIDNAPALADIDNYPLMFGENDEDGESIFKLALDPDDQQLNDPFFADGVGSRFEPSNDLVSLYEDDDIRLSTNFAMLSGRMIINKYRGSESNRDLHEPFIMRTSEMYLIRAEANAAQNNDGDALSDLDAIRSNRIAGFVSPGENGDALDAAVILERRRELAYEGFRFFDIRRYSEDVVRTDCTSDECTLPSDNFKFVYPIPRAEIFANENMVQNDGY